MPFPAASSVIWRGPHGALIEGPHRAIITLDQHHAILRLRQRFYRSPRQNRRSARDYPFTRVLRCARCGGTMGASYAEKDGYGRTTYRCIDRARGKSECTQPAVHTRIVEAAVGRMMARLWIPRPTFERASALSDPAIEQQRAAARRESLEQRRRRARQLYLCDEMSEGEWTREKERIAHEMRRLPDPSEMIGALPTATDGRWQSLSTVWRHASTGEQKVLARLLFASIPVDGQEVGVITLTDLGRQFLRRRRRRRRTHHHRPARASASS